MDSGARDDVGLRRISHQIDHNKALERTRARRSISRPIAPPGSGDTARQDTSHPHAPSLTLQHLLRLRLNILDELARRRTLLDLRDHRVR